MEVVTLEVGLNKSSVVKKWGKENLQKFAQASFMQVSVWHFDWWVGSTHMSGQELGRLLCCTSRSIEHII